MDLSFLWGSVHCNIGVLARGLLHANPYAGGGGVSPSETPASPILCLGIDYVCFALQFVWKKSVTSFFVFSSASFHFTDEEATFLNESGDSSAQLIL